MMVKKKKKKKKNKNKKKTKARTKAKTKVRTKTRTGCVNTVDFATKGKINVNTIALGFRGEKNIGIYGILDPRISKNVKTPLI